MKRSKAYKQAAELVDREQLYSPLEAAELAKKTSATKMDATVEVAMRLGVDPRKADQMVRGTVNLPHGTGKTARVIVFAVGDKATEAEAAGADAVGSDDLIARIQGGWLDFDAAIATPDQMAKVGQQDDDEVRGSAVGIMMDDTEVFDAARAFGDVNAQLKMAVELGKIAIWRHDLRTTASTTATAPTSCCRCSRGRKDCRSRRCARSSTPTTSRW